MNEKPNFPGAEVPKEKPSNADFATGLGARMLGKEQPPTPEAEPAPDTVQPVPDVVEPTPDVVQPIIAEEPPNPAGVQPRTETPAQGFLTQGYGRPEDDLNHEQKAENPALTSNTSDNTSPPPSDGSSPPSPTDPSSNTTDPMNQSNNPSDPIRQKYQDQLDNLKSSPSDNVEPNDDSNEGRRVGPKVVPRENDKSSVHDGQPGQSIPDNEMAKRQAAIEKCTVPRPQSDNSDDGEVKI